MVGFNGLRHQRGFTLLEVLLIVAIIAVLAGVVIIAVNPGRQLGNSRNAQRQADVTKILDIVYRYTVDNGGTPPPGITEKTAEICATGASTCTGLVDLNTITSRSKYVTSLPKDPQCGTHHVCSANGTGYKIRKDANNHLTVTAPSAEQGKSISVTRQY